MLFIYKQKLRRILYDISLRKYSSKRAMFQLVFVRKVMLKVSIVLHYFRYKDVYFNKSKNKIFFN